MATPEEVHRLRTQLRRLEATLHALKLDRTKRGRRVLESIVPIRKAAGKVRDMDVLTGLASSISAQSSDSGDEVVQLLEDLGARRFRFAERLRQTISRDRKLTRRLRRVSARIDRWIERAQSTEGDDRPGKADAAASVMSLSGALSAKTRLSRNSLHPFRLKAKELRYMLELAQDPNKELVDALGETKDAIGEWHDWCELETLARDLLGNGELVRQIHSIAGHRLSEALAVAINLQKKYFGAGKRQGSKRPVRFERPVLTSAAQMSA